MIERYAEVIEKLPRAARAAALERLGLPTYPDAATEVLAAARIDQAALVVALLRTGHRAAAEALVGHSIKVCAPGTRDAPPERSLYARAQWVAAILGPDTGPASDARRVTGVAPNPRLPTTDSFQRWRILHVGMTVGQFLRRGGRRRDVREWTREGTLEVGP